MTRYLHAFLSILIIALFEGCTAGKFAAKDATSRIINGTIISIEDAPFMVQIRRKQDNFTNCGGTLISLQHILTAAHCFESGYTKDDYFVVAGASFRNETGIRREITEVFKLPNRIEGEYGNDVAIIKLDTPYVEGKNIKAQTKFCSNLPDVGKFVRVTGWGVKNPVGLYTTFNENDFSNELRLVRVPLITNDDCLARAKLAFEAAPEIDAEPFAEALNNTLVCAYKKYYDACTTDSGGAGMYGDELCMVVAGGFGCAYGEYPAYYTSVPTILDFINEKLKA